MGQQLSTVQLRKARVKLLAAAVVATMFSMMLPQAPPKERALKARVEPIYPELARLLGITGAVELALTVDCIGRVVRVSTLAGETLLVEAAEAAVRQWRFTPGPGEVTVRVIVPFSRT